MIGRPTRFVHAGSVIGEVLIDVPHAPGIGGTVRGTDVHAQTAGGFRPLRAAQRQGLPGAVAGRIGSGMFGRLMIDALQRHEITMMREPMEGDQGLVISVREPDGSITRVETPGVEIGLTLAELEQIEVHDTDAIYIDGYDLMGEVAGASLSSWLGQGNIGNAMVVFNPGPLVSDISDNVMDAVLRRTDILTLTAREFALLTGVEVSEGAVSAATDVRDLIAPDGLVLVRKGGQRCTLYGENLTLIVTSPRPLTMEQERYAADVLIGVFVAELARGSDIQTALRRSVCAWSVDVGPTEYNEDGLPLHAIGPTREALDQAWDACTQTTSVDPSGS